MKGKYILLIFIIILIFVVKCENLFSQDKSSGENNIYGQWFVWKYENASELEQKKVISYFNEINKILETATDTQKATKECKLGNPDPKRAYKIVNQLIEAVTKINPPLLCKKHYNLSLQVLKSVAGYQKKRSDFGDEKFVVKRNKNHEFEEKIRKEQLKEVELITEITREFYLVLRKIGFYDNVLEEMLSLKLITPEEKKELEKEKNNI